MTALEVGSKIHGFASGAFGRDSYACRTVEAAGPDWIVTRNTNGEVEFAGGRRIAFISDPDDRSYCDADCDAQPLERRCWDGRFLTDACGEPTREDVFNGVWCACERGVPGIDLRVQAP